LFIKNNKIRFSIITFILTLSAFLRLYRLNDLMPFIGDFAWFYISARDMILSGNIPLVGIASSHTWVHQGPLWTYILAIPLLISNFNPVSGGYLAAILGVLTVFLVYKIGTQMFSRFVGFAAAFLYASSPLVVVHARMPYHTSFIPLMALLFVFFIYRWIKGDIRFLPLAVFALGVLYNLELATMVFWILLILIFAYGFIKRKLWFTQALKPNVIFLSIFLFLLVMLPMIIHDVREYSGFYQTTAFFRLIKIYLFSSSHTILFEAMPNIFSSLFLYNQRLVFLANGTIAYLFTLISFFFLTLVIYKRHKKKKSILSLLLLGLWITIPLCAILIGRTASEAYMPILFPAIILSISLLFSYIYKRHALIAFVGILLFVIVNSYLLITKNYLMKNGYGVPIIDRINVVNKIIKESGEEEYNIRGIGEGSQYESFAKGYEYLAWWLGKQPSKKKTKMQFTIQETSNEVIINNN